MSTNAERRKLAAAAALILINPLDPTSKQYHLAQFTDAYLQEFIHEARGQVQETHQTWLQTQLDAKSGRAQQVNIDDAMYSKRSAAGRLTAVVRHLQGRNVAVPKLRVMK